MNILIAVQAAASILLLVFLIIQHRKNEKLVDENGRLKGRLELLEEVRKDGQPSAAPEPLTLEKIADAVRMEGFFPEMAENGVRFKGQGESFYIDAERLPLVFVVKEYGLDPGDWEMDLLRDAAHRMSDHLIMVKAIISDEGKSLGFFVAAQDRNYESFRANLAYYLRLIEDGQRKMNEEYQRMVDEKRQADLAARPVIPPAKPENKLLS